jgi:hypothetical protein
VHKIRLRYPYIKFATSENGIHVRQEVKYWGERGGCPTPGCRGVGHIKGEKFSSHHTASACPYAPQNVESTNLLPDRLKVGLGITVRYQIVCSGYEIWCLFLTPGSQTHIFESLVTNFWVKSTTGIVLCELAKKIFLYLFKNIIISIL